MLKKNKKKNYVKEINVTKGENLDTDSLKNISSFRLIGIHYSILPWCAGDCLRYMKL